MAVQCTNTGMEGLKFSDTTQETSTMRNDFDVQLMSSIVISPIKHWNKDK
jgi:hypothetical protein